MRRNPSSRSSKAARPKTSQATGRDKPVKNPKSPPGTRLSAKEREAQEAHREFLEKLAKTRGEGFVWLDD